MVAPAIPAEQELRRERGVWRLSRERSMRSGRMRRATGIAGRVEGRYAPPDLHPSCTLPCTFLCAALRVAAFGLQRESA